MVDGPRKIPIDAGVRGSKVKGCNGLLVISHNVSEFVCLVLEV